MAAVGSEEMASREILEDVIERLTVQLKLTKATLKSTSEEFQQTQKNLETLEKEHKGVIHEMGELKQREERSEGIGEESVGESIGVWKQTVRETVSGGDESEAWKILGKW